MRNPRPSVHLTCEALQDRVLPASNVLVSVQHGVVFVRGDNNKNGLEIAPDPTTGRVAFRGLDGTKVNGSSAPFLLPEGSAIGGLDIDLRGGDDHVVIANRSEADPHWPTCTCPLCTGAALSINGKLSLDVGTGKDIVQVRNVTIQGALRMNTGVGADVVVLERVTVGGKLTADLGTDADAMLLRA